MKAALPMGLALTAVGTAGYAVGVAAPYPGRSISVTVVMVGVTLAAIGRSKSPEDEP
ncbi:hypothetical protein C475_20108 [Halosimplex carlsbadense 2-9-1]|uniref:Uncharacterized protein n=1 Tax=Halosimplex carlsbadense 2-9-1 TaxID=797114 RepID=M0CDA4_9EURY|nr:hypothetical protein [Halosimplex carlsbadense]ELZ20603.1 hypothetical protein C475_20108 [Halosimplex carlsbadense 2-9-1]